MTVERLLRLRVGIAGAGRRHVERHDAIGGKPRVGCFQRQQVLHEQSRTGQQAEGERNLHDHQSCLRVDGRSRYGLPHASPSRMSDPSGLFARRATGHSPQMTPVTSEDQATKSSTMPSSRD